MSLEGDVLTNPRPSLKRLSPRQRLVRILEVVEWHTDRAKNLTRAKLIGMIAREARVTWETVHDDVRQLLASGDMRVEWGHVRITASGRQLLRDIGRPRP